MSQGDAANAGNCQPSGFGTVPGWFNHRWLVHILSISSSVSPVTSAISAGEKPLDFIIRAGIVNLA